MFIKGNNTRKIDVSCVFLMFMFSVSIYLDGNFEPDLIICLAENESSNRVPGNDGLQCRNSNDDIQVEES